ncbi:hypothetical protein [Streptomyces sp. NPDC059378]|uniref:hypothetical protein n=1 Tax=Streptomyces sp. NPDC059378 TaxID=3346815 RepID=UPI0036A9D56C
MSRTGPGRAAGTRPRSRVGRALAGCAAASALLCGCGVQATDVIEAGGPATVPVYPAYKHRAVLFFLDSAGRLTPAVRSLVPDLSSADVPVPLPKTLALLLAGLSDEERSAGLRTDLPPGAAAGAEVKTAPGTLIIRLPLDVRSLSDGARRQLVCTAAYAQDGDGTAKVTLVGDDGVLPAAVC